MGSKFDVRTIIKDHLDTLYVYGSGRRSKFDLFVSFVFPLAVSLMLIFYGVHLSDGLIGVLSTLFSIFVALLFNLLILVYELLKKEEEYERTNPGDSNGQRRKVLREVFSNISFSVLLSILALIALLASSLKLNVSHLLGLLSLWVFFLLGVFLVNLFMILKRIHNLLFITFDANRR